MGLSPGHKTCAGCGAAIAVRQILKAAGKNVIVAQATGCMEVTTTQYPQTAWEVPWIHVTFENAPAVASGIESALHVMKKDTKVIALGGDGGLIDIGIRSVSGALERQHKLTIICYDNEAYMNTGVQRSGATPYGAATTTSPPGKLSIGNDVWKKDMPGIVRGHHVRYLATTSIGYPDDLIKKVRYALENQPSYVHVHAPCPVGWGFPSSKTIKIAKLAVESGLWAVYEEKKTRRYTIYPTQIGEIEEYFSLQKRFKHLDQVEIGKIKKRIIEYWQNVKMEKIK
jgi:pyruvate ferredoxin oxidoreductase beta subunit